MDIAKKLSKGRDNACWTKSDNAVIAGGLHAQPGQARDKRACQTTAHSVSSSAFISSKAENGS